MTRLEKEMWVKSLRSRNYIQGPDRLRSLDNKFCCLGVFHDTIYGNWEIGNSTYHAIFPDNTTEISNIKESSLSYKWREHLISLNDSGATFDSIANLIESYI